MVVLVGKYVCTLYIVRVCVYVCIQSSYRRRFFGSGAYRTRPDRTPFRIFLKKILHSSLLTSHIKINIFLLIVAIANFKPYISVASMAGPWHFNNIIPGLLRALTNYSEVRKISTPRYNHIDPDRSRQIFGADRVHRSVEIENSSVYTQWIHVSPLYEFPSYISMLPIFSLCVHVILHACVYACILKFVILFHCRNQQKQSKCMADRIYSFEISSSSISFINIHVLKLALLFINIIPFVIIIIMLNVTFISKNLKHMYLHPFNSMLLFSRCSPHYTISLNFFFSFLPTCLVDPHDKCVPNSMYIFSVNKSKSSKRI